MISHYQSLTIIRFPWSITRLKSRQIKGLTLTPITKSILIYHKRHKVISRKFNFLETTSFVKQNKSSKVRWTTPTPLSPLSSQYRMVHVLKTRATAAIWWHLKKYRMRRVRTLFSKRTNVLWAIQKMCRELCVSLIVKLNSKDTKLWISSVREVLNAQNLQNRTYSRWRT